jgi:hypothetical protein
MGGLLRGPSHRCCLHPLSTYIHSYIYVCLQAEQEVAGALRSELADVKGLLARQEASIMSSMDKARGEVRRRRRRGVPGLSPP